MKLVIAALVVCLASYGASDEPSEVISVGRDVPPAVQCDACKIIETVIIYEISLGVDKATIEAGILLTCQQIQNRSIAEECEFLVGSQFDELYDAAKASNGSASKACIIAEDCKPPNSTLSEEESSPMVSLEKPMCSKCRNLFARITHRLLGSGQVKRETMRSNIVDLCRGWPHYMQTICERGLLYRLDSFVDTLETLRDPEKICPHLRLC